ncbi:MAG: type II toxin-antitoxin system Phd/YefM family antitoxin [Acidobacteriota bacterium]
MKVTATALRQNIYAILDQALATGEPIEVERKGKTLKIVPPKQEGRLAKLAKMKSRNLVIGDPDELIHMDWSQYWNEEKNLDLP